MKPWAIMQDFSGGWLRFREPVRQVSAHEHAEVAPALSEIEHCVETQGLWAVGYLAYEAGPGLDAALEAGTAERLPLLRFCLYRGPERLHSLPDGGGAYAVGTWLPSCSETEYRQAIAAIRGYIHAGDTYQVNYTVRLHARFSGDPYGFFRSLCRAQNAGHCAYLDYGRECICSASPELFFHRDGSTVECRPMKGTAARGHTYSEDLEQIGRLHTSEKDRAENVMILDMVRNDLGRVAEPGSVRVVRQFEVERYPTVLQMTSTAVAECPAGSASLLAALFPCASITGAPKVRATQIIRELETGPRGIYTGAIGYLAPGRQACFNVAIRTVHIDRETGKAEYGVGGGIVWDSDAAAEYAECLQKARVLTVEYPDFELLETMRWTRQEGCFLLDAHLERLRRSAAYFCFPDVTEDIRRALAAKEHGFSAPQRVRVLVSRVGDVRVETAALDPDADPRTWRLALASDPVDSDDVFLYHKTTHRAVYERAKADRAGYDDVVLVNREGWVTETTVGNLAARFAGQWVTPPVSCGLLAGTYRAHLLERGEIRERPLHPDDLERADELCVLNSVRGRVPAALVG